MYCPYFVGLIFTFPIRSIACPESGVLDALQTSYLILSHKGVPSQDVYLGLTRSGTVVAYPNPQGNYDWSERLNVPSDLKDVVQVALTESTAFAVIADGTVVSWGRDGWGLKSSADGLENIVRIEGGQYHFLAIDRSGVMTSYGDGWGVVPAAASRPSPDCRRRFSVANGVQFKWKWAMNCS